MTALDIHAHFYPPEYCAVVAEIADELGAHAETARAFLAHRIIQSVPAFTGCLDERIAMMDAAGIDLQVLSFASLNIWHPDPAVRMRLAAAYNDGCAAAVLAHPHRLRFLATLPLPHAAEAAEEARRVRELPGFVGYTVPTHIASIPIDDPRWEPVYSAMNEAPSLVLAHPDGFCAPGALDVYSMEWGLGAPFEDTIAVVRLLCSGIIDRFPALRWVVPHLGGTLPFLLHRLVWRWRLEAEALGTADRAQIPLDRVLFDTANSTPSTLALALDTLPAHSIVFGTDFPFVDPGDLRRPVEMVSGLGRPVDSILSGTLGPLLAPFAPTKGGNR
ncbi:amidohydrolase family protein [Marisediminicola senii]|uniref:amidohydrolase family protein n=1 Tax=Marisediminicola senii TaxID=2711233 RepID=UPI0013ED73C9|nr:amidohydrolase family protein [Marisediminicola senii]